MKIVTIVMLVNASGDEAVMVRRTETPLPTCQIVSGATPKKMPCLWKGKHVLDLDPARNVVRVQEVE